MTTIYQLDQELRERLEQAGVGELLSRRDELDEYEPPTPSDTQDYQDNYRSEVL